MRNLFRRIKERLKSSFGARRDAVRPDAVRQAPGRIRPGKRSDLVYTIVFLIGLVVYGTCTALVWAWTQQPFLKIGASALLVLGSAGVFGGLVGFLFGIPRSQPEASLIQDAKGGGGVGTLGGGGAAVASATTEGASNQAGGPSTDGRGSSGRTTTSAASMGVNTNLEQISDWLTKIIVGVGLTQFHDIPGRFDAAAQYFAHVFIESENLDQAVIDSLSAIAATLLLYGSIGGFLGGYLLTRMFLPGAFDRMQEYLGQRQREQEERIRQQQFEVEEMQFEAARQKQKIDARNEEIVRDQNTLAEQKTKIKAAQTEFIARQQELTRTQAELTSQQGELDNMRIRVFEAQRTIQEQKTEIDYQKYLSSLEDVIYQNLYEKGGSSRAIQIGEAFLAAYGAPTSARFWAYLACAYGMAHHAHIQGDMTAPDYEEKRKMLEDKAFEAVQKALSADQGWKPMLRVLWDTQINNGDENDLEDFYDIPRFKELLG